MKKLLLILLVAFTANAQVVTHMHKKPVTAPVGGVPDSVLFDNVTTQYYAYATSGAQSLSHTTTSESNTIMVVHMSVWPVSAVPPSMSYNGTGLTLIDDTDNGTNVNGNLWVLVGPDAGTHNLTWTPSTGCEMHVAIATYYNVDQVTGYRNETGTADNASPYVISGSGLTDGDLRLGLLASYGTVDSWTGQIRWNTTRTGDEVNTHGSDIKISGTTQNMTFTNTDGNEKYVVQAVSIIPYTP